MAAVMHLFSEFQRDTLYTRYKFEKFINKIEYHSNILAIFSMHK